MKTKVGFRPAKMTFDPSLRNFRVNWGRQTGVVIITQGRMQVNVRQHSWKPVFIDRAEPCSPPGWNVFIFEIG